MRICQHCRHTECNRCRELKARSGLQFCCQCHRQGFVTPRKASVTS